MIYVCVHQGDIHSQETLLGLKSGCTVRWPQRGEKLAPWWFMQFRIQKGVKERSAGVQVATLEGSVESKKIEITNEKTISFTHMKETGSDQGSRAPVTPFFDPWLCLAASSYVKNLVPECALLSVQPMVGKPQGATVLEFLAQDHALLFPTVLSPLLETPCQVVELMAHWLCLNPSLLSLSSQSLSFSLYDLIVSVFLFPV